METYNSSTRLLQADLLDVHFDSGISNEGLSDNGSTSGYDSSDSSPMQQEVPTQVTHVRPQRAPEVMMFSSTNALCDRLQYILTMPDLCDVTFFVGKDRVPVHGVKAILATRSRVMYQLILYHQRKATDESSKKLKRKRNEHSLSIPIADYDVAVFTSFVKFLHCGKAKVNITNAVGLVCAATEYGLRDLTKACWDFIRRCIGQGQGQTDKLLTSCAEYNKKKAAQKLIAEISDKKR